MIIVDSSVWISYFHNHPVQTAEKLERLLFKREDLALPPFVLTEVLMGFKNDTHYSKAKKILSKIHITPLSSNLFITSAELYRKLRKKGVAVRGAIDCIIAQTCLDLGAELFTLDRDFEKISKHCSLKLLK